MSPNTGDGVCGVSANEYSCAHGAQIDFRDLTPYLTYGSDRIEYIIYGVTTRIHTVK
jgi:hypothetical protein